MWSGVSQGREWSGAKDSWARVQRVCFVGLLRARQPRQPVAVAFGWIN